MLKARAAAGSVLFFLVAPGVVAGVLPWWISGWNLPRSTSLLSATGVALGALIVLAGLFVLVRAFVRFVVEGLGTPAPVAPTENLVVGGDYRYVRNPMYVAVVAIILGQSLVFASPALLLYAVAAWLVMASFVHWHEEPVLRRRFGTAYLEYCRNVRAWLPRRRPWSG
jgi:protein-S-isoprenylcysteine O-methyltransferase Ste14